MKNTQTTVKGNEKKVVATTFEEKIAAIANVAVSRCSYLSDGLKKNAILRHKVEEHLKSFFMIRQDIVMNEKLFIETIGSDEAAKINSTLTARLEVKGNKRTESAIVLDSPVCFFEDSEKYYISSKYIEHKKNTGAINLPESLLIHEEGSESNVNINAPYICLTETTTSIKDEVKSKTYKLSIINIELLAVVPVLDKTGKDNYIDFKDMYNRLGKGLSYKGMKGTKYVIPAIEKLFNLSLGYTVPCVVDVVDQRGFDKALTQAEGKVIMGVQPVIYDEEDVANNFTDVKLGYYTNDSKHQHIKPRYDDATDYVALVREESKYGITFKLIGYKH